MFNNMFHIESSPQKWQSELAIPIVGHTSATSSFVSITIVF